MKKAFSIILSITMLLALTSCGSNSASNSGPVLPTVSAKAQMNDNSTESETGIEEKEKMAIKDAMPEDTDENESQPTGTEAEESQYNAAIDAARSGEYIEAVSILRGIKGYQDSSLLLKEFAISAVRKYINENGEPYSVKEEEFRDSFVSFNKAIKTDYNELAVVLLALDEQEQVTFALINDGEITRTDTGGVGAYMCDSFVMPLSETSNTSEYQLTTLIIMLGAYTLCGANGSIDTSEFTMDSELTVDKIHQIIKKTDGTISENDNESLENAPSISSLLRAVNERMIPTLEDQLLEIGLTLNDLGFAGLP